MKTLQRLQPILCLVGLLLMSGAAYGQPPTQNVDGGTPSRGPGKPVTIPLTIRMSSNSELTELTNIDLTVNEDGVRFQTRQLRSRC